jgi:hypothetical protein
VPSISTVQVKVSPLASRTRSGQRAAPTRSSGLFRFWVLTSSFSTSVVPTSWSSGAAAGCWRPAPPHAASRHARTMAVTGRFTQALSAALRWD